MNELYKMKSENERKENTIYIYVPYTTCLVPTYTKWDHNFEWHTKWRTKKKMIYDSAFCVFQLQLATNKIIRNIKYVIVTPHNSVGRRKYRNVNEFFFFFFQNFSVSHRMNIASAQMIKKKKKIDEEKEKKQINKYEAKSHCI